jgi:putative SOS response-associated peptidase YedK
MTTGRGPANLGQGCLQIGFHASIRLTSSVSKPDRTRQDVPVIVRDGTRNVVKPMRCGLVSSWSQDPAIGNQMIDARSETLHQRRSFWQAIL